MYLGRSVLYQIKKLIYIGYLPEKDVRKVSLKFTIMLESIKTTTRWKKGFVKRFIQEKDFSTRKIIILLLKISRKTLCLLELFFGRALSEAKACLILLNSFLFWHNSYSEVLGYKHFLVIILTQIVTNGKLEMMTYKPSRRNQALILSLVFYNTSDKKL